MLTLSAASSRHVMPELNHDEQHLEQGVEGDSIRFEPALLQVLKHGERMLQLLSPRADSDH